MPEPPAARRGLHKILLVATVAATVGLCVLAYWWAGPDRENEGCAWVFVRYEPSPWEVEWSQGVISGERRDRECDVLATPPEVDRSVRLVRATRDAVLGKKPIPPDSVGLFSRMVYSKRCGGDRQDTGQQRVQLIEPLVGIIRDPLTMCPRPGGVSDDVYDSFGFGESHVQSKRHFLIGTAAPWTDTPDKPTSWRVGGFEPWALDTTATHDRRARQNILIDIGASTYSSWSGSTSAVGAAWFVDRFKRHDLAFDWIVSYEYDKHDPDEIYQTVPADVLPHYIYFNQPVEKDPNGKWNPWRMLRGMGATPNDYVIVKLDIDTPDIENPLVDQLMKDDGLRALVDEMFYEHHVNTKTMWRYWRTDQSPIVLADTYKNFAFLRSRGVRMHSWP
jgi:hypothetical protein